MPFFFLNGIKATSRMQNLLLHVGQGQRDSNHVSGVSGFWRRANLVKRFILFKSLNYGFKCLLTIWLCSYCMTWASNGRWHTARCCSPLLQARPRLGTFALSWYWPCGLSTCCRCPCRPGPWRWREVASRPRLGTPWRSSQARSWSWRYEEIFFCFKCVGLQVAIVCFFNLIRPQTKHFLIRLTGLSFVHIENLGQLN